MGEVAPHGQRAGPESPEWASGRRGCTRSRRGVPGPRVAPTAPLATRSAGHYRAGMGYDVLVIGGGIAGSAAALAAAGRGARVALVRAAPGVTAMAEGGWAGPVPPALGAALADAGLRLVPAPGPLPHPAGELRRYDVAAASHAAVPLTGGVLVCGIAGLPGFVAPALARLWGDAAAVPLAAAVLDLGRATPPAGWAPASLAAMLDGDAALLAAPLAALLAERKPPGVLLPAVLGVERTDAVLAAARERTGVPAGEALGMPPSLPGWRLDRALLAALEAAGVEHVAGRVVGTRAAGTRLVAVLVEEPGAGGPPRAVEAAAFVLATGKFAGGGLRAGRSFREPALGVEVGLEALGRVFDDAQPIVAAALERAGAQPLLEVGVHVDGDGRPAAPDGAVPWRNVRAAGTVRRGLGAAAPGLGLAAADGWEAGLAAAAPA